MASFEYQLGGFCCENLATLFLEFNGPWSPSENWNWDNGPQKTKLNRFWMTWVWGHDRSLIKGVNCCFKHTETTDRPLFHNARFSKMLLLLGQIQQASTMSRIVEHALQLCYIPLTLQVCPVQVKKSGKIFLKGFSDYLCMTGFTCYRLQTDADMFGHAETYIHLSKVSKRHWDFVIHDFSD